MVKFIEKELGNGEINLSHIYDHNYKEKAFWIWYNEGRLPSHRLIERLRETENVTPSPVTVQGWFIDWKDRADELDQEVKDKFSKEVVDIKVEMLRRHAAAGKELQDIGMTWLRSNVDNLTAAAVTRIIKDGYEMERASVGVPEALTKMLSVSNEDLKEQIEALLTGDDLDLDLELLDADK